MVRLGLVVAVFALVTVACGPAPADGEAAANPRLSFAATDPVAVRGVGFRPREKVRLLVSSPRPSTKTVVTDRRGCFLTRFGFRAGRCGEIVIQAIGGRGSRAQISFDAPHCVPPTVEP